ncbi:MAG: GGDEF domain-containing protein [Lachnospiraceae bacterium]|nr:GGDEF domain-containing protein [Lachnospiraceae bacterium]
MENNNLKHFKLFKMMQLLILAVFAVAFFCYLYFDPLLRNNIYSNKNLLTLCVFLWAFMIYSAITIIMDFKQLDRNIADSHLLNQAAYLDKLTRLPNRNTLDLLIDKYAGKDISRFACALITINNLSEINKRSGRDSGNETLKEFSGVFEEVGEKYGFFGRNGGNEFVVVMEECSYEKMQQFVDEISKAITTYNRTHDNESLELSFKYALNIEENVASLPELISRMYNNWKRG